MLVTAGKRTKRFPKSVALWTHFRFCLLHLCLYGALGGGACGSQGKGKTQHTHSKFQFSTRMKMDPHSTGMSAFFPALLHLRSSELAADVCGKSLASIGSPSSSLVSFPIAPIQQSELQTTSGAGVTLTGRSQLWPYGPVPLLSSRFLQAQRQSDGMTTGDPPP